MDKKTVLRKAKNTASDIAAVTTLISYGSKIGKILPRDADEITQVIESFYLYSEGDTIVGCCAIEIYNQRLSEIRSLVVLPDYQNKGIAQKLLKACILEGTEKGVYQILAISDKDTFFEKFGFGKSLNKQWSMFLPIKKKAHHL